MGAASQLLLLLWKCWKTTLRSTGWTIVQCLFTIALWAILLYIKYEKVDRYLPNSPNIDEYSSPTYEKVFIDYKCDGTCGGTLADIRSTAKKVCPDNSEICSFFEESTLFYRQKYTLKFYELNDSPPVLNADFIYGNSRDCARLGESSEHFDHGGHHSCEANHPFRPYIAWTGAFLFFYCIPLILFCAQATREVSEEATNNMKDYLLSMGMSRSMYYLHHFIYTYLKAWISIIGCSIIFAFIFKSGGIGVILFLLFSLSLMAWVGMSLMIGALIKKPGTSTFVFFILSLALTFLSCTIVAKRTHIFTTLFLSLVSPQFAVRFAMDSYREGEFRGIFVAFADVGDVVQYGFILIMMVLSAVMYTALAILMDWILTTLENPLTLMRRSKIFSTQQSQIIAENHEEMRTDEPPVLVIKDVHKRYPMGEYAVRGVNVDMFKGQVTALLGHNGAGKSTLFSMISGMTVPSRGSIKIMDSTTRAEQQQLIGYCPQYNAIFPKLTVDEHLKFFSHLKGVDKWKGTGQKVLEILGMSDKGEVKASELSGGMKRKLGIAIALAANSPIVLLDEPTAGMDTGARRDFERLLMEWKREHAILLTTHYTDEAEMLADRIFIMANGRVFCSGSTQFLRKRFLSGCILSFSAKKEVDPNAAAAAILERIKEFVPDTQIDRIRGQQFDLRLNSDDKTRHTEMFRMIEDEAAAVGIASYSLSLTKLEQVFLKVGEMTGTKSREAEISGAIRQLIHENENRLPIPGKFGMQMLYLFMKRLHYDFAHLPSLIIKIILLIIIAAYVPSSMIKLISGGHETSEDLLRLSDCYRVGLHSSLHDKIDQFEKAKENLGYCLRIEKFSDTAAEWIESTSSQRPPLLGTLTKEGEDWTIHTYTRNEALLPALQSLAAMANRPELTKVTYSLKNPPQTKDIPVELQESENQLNQLQIQAMFVCLLIFTVPLMVMRPMGFHIIDDRSHFAHQQRLTGISKAVLLLATFIYDFIAFNIHLLFFFIPLIISHMDLLSKMTAESLLIPLVSFLQAELIILLCYRVFATRAMGESLITFFFFILGFLCLAAIAVCVRFNKKIALLASPLSAVLVAIYAEYGAVYMKKAEENPQFETIVQDVASLRATAIVFAILHLVLLLIPLLCMEFRFVERLRADFAKKREASSRSLETADLSDGNGTILKVRNLHKTYGLFTKVPAVNGISFDVRAHECFGVLGVNGAGKTSTFEVLTGNASPTSGFASVGGVDCSAPATIGYCPQIDALIDDLSGFQSLVVLAALHGYRNPRKVANILIDCVGMQKHANKSSKQYSGGQRRKISVAAALLAQNSLIILDEPTAGIDPVARRDVWNVICVLREATNTAVVLTSHSMDEVETLVSTLMIMSRGSIVVMGTPQSVKNQFGAHYEFTLIAEDDSDPELITVAVMDEFPMAEPLDSGSSRVLKYRIARRKDDIFSSIYAQAELLAKELNAADFYLTQATLDDAFVIAANMNVDEKQSIAPVMRSPSVAFNTKTDEVSISGHFTERYPDNLGSHETTGF